MSRLGKDNSEKGATEEPCKLMSDLWYRDSSFSVLGRKVSHPTRVCWRCQRCSECCRDAPNHLRRIRLLPMEAVEISKETSIPVEQFACETQDQTYRYEMSKPNGACYFLNGNQCRLYDHRPLVCRFYPFEMKNEEGSLKILFAGEGCVGRSRGQRLGERFFRRLATEAIEKLNQQPCQS